MADSQDVWMLLSAEQQQQAVDALRKNNITGDNIKSQRGREAVNAAIEADIARERAANDNEPKRGFFSRLFG